ncbi:hypothetical protein R4K89_12115 [Brachyspira intermedia]|uniref:hypothetical protein n=1 Tax=Brachyspira intermedia TaxID=84377 RepID=UPI0030041206
MNNLNDNITKIKEGDISWRVSENYLKMNDEMGDMSREINDTVVYLNDLINSVKGTANKISEDSNNISEIVYKINDCCNNNEMDQNQNSNLVNNVNKNLKSLLEESRELQKIIKYFKLKE